MEQSLSQPSRMVLTKMQAAAWAAKRRAAVYSAVGLHPVGCLICGDKRDICPNCRRCKDHHDSRTSVDSAVARKLSITNFITAFCQSDASSIMSALDGIVDPEVEIERLSEPCHMVPVEVDEEVELDMEVWGSAFEDNG